MRAHKPSPITNYLRRVSRFMPLQLSICFLTIAGLIFSAENLHDYDAYGLIYQIDGANYIQADKDIYFAVFVGLIKSFGFNYVQFRYITFLISLGMFSYSLSNIHNWLKRDNFNNDQAKLSKINPLLMIVIMSAFLVFLLEIFLVRIRAGIAISLMSLAFSLCISINRKNRLINLSLTLILMFISYGFHSNTTIMLGYLLFMPFLLSSYTSSASENSKLSLSFISRCLSYSISILVSFLLILVVSNISEDRGEEMFSPLNEFRFLCISIIPLLLAVYTNITNKKFKDIYSSLRTSQRRLSWIKNATINYISIALALFVMYFSGLVNASGSGEAIVRIFTLSSVPAIFVILLGSNRYSIVWCYILCSNSLFFMNTLGIFLPER